MSPELESAAEPVMMVERQSRNSRASSSRNAPVGLRVALIGCGAISQQMHLPVLAGHDRLKLAVLVDRDLKRAQKFATGYGNVQMVDDASKLTAGDVDAAIIASPPFHHAACTIDLVRKGIHVLVEKPMATSLADAERMVAEADKAGVTLSVGFFRRLYPSIQLMKALLDSNWAGGPQRFLIEGGGMYSWGAATLGNMRRDLAGGGALIDFGSHMIDLLFALFDEPAEVLEYRDNALGGIEADGTAQVRVRHQGAPIEGRIEVARTRNIGSFIRVECERATLEFQVNERSRIKVLPRGTELVDPITREPREFWFDASWRDAASDESWYATFGRQYTDWIQAIDTHTDPMLSGRSALATSRLIENCYANRQPMAEPWVWRGVTSDGAVAANGRPNPPAVHVPGQSRPILVTGASGFIGCRVVELLRLREKCAVRAVVHNPGNASRLARLDVELVQADLGSHESAHQLVQGCDSVVHCAIGTDWGEPRKIFDVTVNGTKRLAEEALESRLRRFVHVSTMSVYGDDMQLRGELDESTPLQPVRGSVYGESKLAAENAVMELVQHGLSAAVFRPARVFGPFSRIFIHRPLQAIGNGCFSWLGSPDVPCDMVYVDNVAEALITALFAEPQTVSGEAFNLGDGDTTTWRAFYDYFARNLSLDLSNTPMEASRNGHRKSALRSVVSFPRNMMRGVGQIVGSSEFKSLGRRVLSTDPIGTLPRQALGRFPALERGVRKLVKADDSMPIYRPEPAPPDDPVHMGSGGALLNIEKLHRRLGFKPTVSRAEALQLTLDWVRHARIV
jgi:predicted dehydrogenase/nucleoside-diphosphate-sugar epimerase